MSPVGAVEPARQEVTDAVRGFLRQAAPGIDSDITHDRATFETRFALSFKLELTNTITDETIMVTNGRAVQEGIEQSVRLFRDHGIRGLGLEPRIEERIEQERRVAVDAALVSVSSKIREHMRGVSHENHLILTGILAEVQRELGPNDARDRDRERIRAVLEKVATLSAESMKGYPDEPARLADTLWELVR